VAVPTLIEEVALGKKALDVALRGVRLYKRFCEQPDSLGRLLVLLYGSYGRESDLERSVFYSWRRQDELREALERVLAGELTGSEADVKLVAALIEPRLVRTSDQARRCALAEQIARATFSAAPLVVEGGGEHTRLVVGHVRASSDGHQRATAELSLPVRFNVPSVAAAFTGRDVELGLIEQALGAGDRAVVTQAIAGLGGVGKSQLAARFVALHAGEYEIVAWISAQDGAVADLAGLAGRLGVVESEDVSPADRAQRVIAWLGECEHRWLLVLDNVESSQQLAGMLPQGSAGRVLVTSRDRSLRQFGPLLTVDVFGEGVSEDLCRHDRTGASCPSRTRTAGLSLTRIALAASSAVSPEGERSSSPPTRVAWRARVAPSWPMSSSMRRWPGLGCASAACRSSGFPWRSASS
jgi:hypothetical protein